MNKNQIKALSDAVESVSGHETLESIILEISKYGRPSMFQFPNGNWRASCEVNNNVLGTTIKVVCQAETIREVWEGLLKNIQMLMTSLGKASAPEQSHA